MTLEMTRSNRVYGWNVSAVHDQSQMTVQPCVACGDVSAESIFQVEGLPATIVRCVRCGTACYHPPLAPELIGDFYPEEYYGTSGKKFSFWVESAVRLLAIRQSHFIGKLIPAGGRILDVGCGRGTLLAGLAGRNIELYGFELNESAARGLDPRIQLRTGVDLAEANFPSEFFDVVVLWHVLEHLPQPRETILEIRRILKPGGRIVVAVPNFSSDQAEWAGCHWFHLDPPRHLFHFPLAGLKQLLKGCGFSCRSAHHFSLRQNPFGWQQSAMNKWMKDERNSLYCLLHRDDQNSSVKRPPLKAAKLLTAFVIGMPICLVLSIWEALCRRGGTVHVVAQREDVGRID